MTIEHIEKDLKEGNLHTNPILCSQYRGWLAGDYSTHAGLLEMIVQRKAAIWNELRKQVNSDKATDRLYEATTDGVDEQTIRIRLKRLEKLMSALGTLIKIAEGEARNNY